MCTYYTLCRSVCVAMPSYSVEIAFKFKAIETVKLGHTEQRKIVHGIFIRLRLDNFCRAHFDQAVQLITLEHSLLVTLALR